MTRDTFDMFYTPSLQEIPHLAQIVAELMPIGGDTEVCRALTLYVRGVERLAREYCAQIADKHDNSCGCGTARTIAAEIRKLNSDEQIHADDQVSA